MQSRYKKLFTDTGLFAISNFSSKVLTFLLVPLYTSMLTTEEYGSVDIISTTITLVYPIITLSVYDATLRFALDKKYDNRAVFSTSVVLTFTATLFLVVLTPIFIGSSNFIGRYWWCFIGAFFSTTSHLCVANYIKGRNQTKIFAIQGIINTLVFLCFNIFLLAIVRIGVLGYFLSMIIGHLISTVYMLVASKCYIDLFPFVFNKSVTKEMLIYSIPLIPTSIAWWVNASADKYMILGLIGVSANGLYAVAHKIPSIFSTFALLFSQAWRISAISSFEDEDKQMYYAKVQKMHMLVCLYCCIVLVFSSQLIAKILFKADYYQAWVFVPPLIIAALFDAYSGFLASIYAAAKKTKFLSVSECVGTIVNICLNYTLIRCLGIIGAPIATMISFAVVWLLRLKVMQSFMPIKVNMVRTILSLCILVVASFYYVLQMPYKYIVGILMFAVIVVINYRDTKNLAIMIRGALKSTFQKFGGNKK